MYVSLVQAEDGEVNTIVTQCDDISLVRFFAAKSPLPQVGRLSQHALHSRKVTAFIASAMTMALDLMSLGHLDEIPQYESALRPRGAQLSFSAACLSLTSSLSLSLLSPLRSKSMVANRCGHHGFLLPSVHRTCRLGWTQRTSLSMPVT